MDRINAWNTYDLGMQKSCMDFADDYKDFLDHGKTERECVDRFVNEAEAEGYIELTEAVREGRRLVAGDKVYSVWMNKSMVLFEIGSEPFENGINILGAHIDSPRLDVKQNPLYEDSDIAYLDTHYYGGIKKYQYVTLPLAIHGVIGSFAWERTRMIPYSLSRTSSSISLRSSSRSRLPSSWKARRSMLSSAASL